MPRFTVIPAIQGTGRKKSGYSIHDDVPHFQTTDDAEGVGLVHLRKPMRVNEVTGWFKRKLDAQKRCDELNKP